MSRSVVCRRFNDAELKFCYPDKRGLVFPDFTVKLCASDILGS